MNGMISSDLFKLVMDNIWVIYFITLILNNMGEISVTIILPFGTKIKFKWKTNKPKNFQSDKSDDTPQKRTT